MAELEQQTRNYEKFIVKKLIKYEKLEKQESVPMLKDQKWNKTIRKIGMRSSYIIWKDKP